MTTYLGKQWAGSSVVYFLWNLFLVSSRLAALILFASAVPYFIFITHFVCSWLVLFLLAWRCKETLRGSKSGKWLHWANLGLMWYFNCLNVGTSRAAVLYHGFMLSDILLLCCFWCWRMHTEVPYFTAPPLYTIITASGVSSTYVFGLILKTLSHKCQALQRNSGM